MGQMQRDSNKGKRNMLSEINVTPFVDVMLVLLIIFMVTAPLLQQGINISLPQTQSVGAKMSKEPFILQISKEERIYIGDQSVGLKELSEKLEALFEYKSEKVVYLKADKLVPYGFVAQTLAEIKSSGISSVSLITSTK